VLRRATDVSYPAPLELRWVTRCIRANVGCLCVSTVIDSPQKVPTIAAAPIWFDARLRSHSNGMIASGVPATIGGSLNSPHALALQFHQKKIVSPLFTCFRGLFLAARFQQTFLGESPPPRDPSQNLTRCSKGVNGPVRENDPRPISYKK